MMRQVSVSCHVVLVADRTKLGARGHVRSIELVQVDLLLTELSPGRRAARAHREVVDVL